MCGMDLVKPGISERRRGPKPKLGAAEEDAITRLYSEHPDIPVAEIARIYRVSIRTIYSILAKRRPGSLPGVRAAVQPTEGGITSSEPDDTSSTTDA